MDSENKVPDDEYELEAAKEEPSYELEPAEENRREKPADYLEVEEPPETPPPPPTAPPFPEREPESEPEPGADSEETEPGDEVPTIRPFRALHFLLWPLRHGCGDDFAIVLFILLVVLSGGWLLRQIPAAGPILQALVVFAAAVYFFTYLVKLVRAAAEGRRAPIVWVMPEMGDPGVADGLRAALLFVAHMLPAVIVGCAANTIWAALPLVLLGWALWPATLFNLAAGGTFEAVNPIATVETAMYRRGTYFRIVIPGLFFAAAAFLSSSLIGGVWFGLAMWLCLVYTAVAVGSFAHHDERMAWRARKFSGVEAGDEPPLYEEKTFDAKPGGGNEEE